MSLEYRGGLLRFHQIIRKTNILNLSLRRCCILELNTCFCNLITRCKNACSIPYMMIKQTLLELNFFIQISTSSLRTSCRTSTPSEPSFQTLVTRNITISTSKTKTSFYWKSDWPTYFLKIYNRFQHMSCFKF